MLVGEFECQRESCQAAADDESVEFQQFILRNRCVMRNYNKITRSIVPIRRCCAAKRLGVILRLQAEQAK